MRERPLHEAVLDSFAVDGLLAQTRNHLRHVQGGAFRPALRHDPRRVRPRQIRHQGLPRFLSYPSQQPRELGLQRLPRVAARPQDQLPSFVGGDLRLGLGEAVREQPRFQVEHVLRGRDVVDADRKPSVGPEVAARELREPIHEPRRVGRRVVVVERVDQALLAAVSDRFLGDAAAQQNRPSHDHVPVVRAPAPFPFIRPLLALERDVREVARRMRSNE
mmetsp:Transcript_31166/g.96458  ORF Transcript_31166/g.96458 Transcript_31166/m.96458 type:complete len:219 (+) Transcript_31166:1221-1877(+)